LGLSTKVSEDSIKRLLVKGGGIESKETHTETRAKLGSYRNEGRIPSRDSVVVVLLQNHRKMGEAFLRQVRLPGSSQRKITPHTPPYGRWRRG